MIGQNMTLIKEIYNNFSEEERKKLDLGTEKAKEAIIEIITNGVDSAMNKFN